VNLERKLDWNFQLEPSRHWNSYHLPSDSPQGTDLESRDRVEEGFLHELKLVSREDEHLSFTIPFEQSTADLHLTQWSCDGEG
jgi:hypothetical protein